MLGLSFANVIGVPAATLLGQELGWRSAFWAAAGLGVVTLALVVGVRPVGAGRRRRERTRELAAFTVPQVWLTLLAGAVGFGGMFAVYSYIAPVVTDVAGLGERAGPDLPAVLRPRHGRRHLARRAHGRLVDLPLADHRRRRMAGTMLAFWAAAPHGWAALPVVFLDHDAGSVLVVNLQLRLMDVAGDAQTLGAAMNHASLNIANALGAWLGGLVIAAGWGLRAPALVGSRCRSPASRSCCSRPRAHVRGRDAGRTLIVLPGFNTAGTPA